jgi:hypothetical protein
MLEIAKRNIEESFAVVGLTERFDETLILLHETFGWSRLHYVSANVAPRQAVELPDDVRNLIEEHNQLDIELYRHAGERFDEAIRRYPTFDEELTRFRRTNSLYRPLGLVQDFPRHLSAQVGLRRVLSRTRAPNL